MMNLVLRSFALGLSVVFLSMGMGKPIAQSHSVSSHAIVADGGGGSPDPTGGGDGGGGGNLVAVHLA